MTFHSPHIDVGTFDAPISLIISIPRCLLDRDLDYRKRFWLFINGELSGRGDSRAWNVMFIFVFTLSVAFLPVPIVLLSLRGLKNVKSKPTVCIPPLILQHRNKYQADVFTRNL